MFRLWSNIRSIGACWVCTTLTNMEWKVMNVRMFRAGTGAQVSPEGTVHMCEGCM